MLETFFNSPGVFEPKVHAWDDPKMNIPLNGLLTMFVSIKIKTAMIVVTIIVPFRSVNYVIQIVCKFYFLRKGKSLTFFKIFKCYNKYSFSRAGKKVLSFPYVQIYQYLCI